MNTEYLDQFIEEARENSEELVAGLLRLETEEGDAIAATVGELFRFAHNIKGMAATVGIEAMTIVAHRMEDLLEHYRQGGGSPSPEEIDLLLTGCDVLAAMIDEAAAGTNPEMPTALIAQFDERAAALAPDDAVADEEAQKADSGPVPAPGPEQPASAAPADGNGAPTHRFTIKLAEGCQLPGARAAMVLRTATGAGVVVATAPSREEIFGGGVTDFSLDMSGVEDPAGLATRIAGIADVADISETELAPPKKQTTETGTVQRATVRVEIDRLDALMDLVSELVIARGQLEQQVTHAEDRQIQESVAGTARLISDLQALVAKVRMVTLESTFRRMNRLVRDTARSLDKKITFDMAGAETELDRRMVDELSDPLVHLLRNAADHGIECGEKRLEAGKPEAGQMKLSAYHEGNQVVIEVTDDGPGINTEKVAAKAIENGIVTADDVAALTHAQKLDLVFAPGLSTRTEASTISGRGVGMDVVRSSVTRLGGSVSVESTEGEGSRFRLRLPMSLAVLEALLVKVGAETWAVPLAHIVETIVIGEDDLRWVQGDPVITLRGATLPVIPGGWQLAGETTISTPTPAIVYQYKGRRCALTVDELLTQTEVVVKPLPGSMDAHHVSGVTILGDGTVGLILDLDSVTVSYTSRDRSVRLTLAGTEPTPAGGV
ncbi:MAG: chemotaxis protein CheA [Acidimicrobiia bacterium]|nr:chemotaxis protein CheA [Acidimicrobiia bacterium]